MPRRRDQLAEAHEAIRTLRNQIHQIEDPLRRKIRELEVERDRYAALVKADGDRLHELESGLEAALTFVRWLLSSGKR